MIKVFLYNKAICAKGHANYKEYGEDIYCSAISAILQSSLCWFDKNHIELEISDGLFKLKIINDSNDNLYKLKLLQKQLESFNQLEFEKYILVERKGKDYYEQ